MSYTPALDRKEPQGRLPFIDNIRWVVIVLVVLRVFPAVGGSIALYAAILFVLGVAHAGVRIGRQTHVVDLAGGDRKAEYVALSNTVIGVLLLVVGGLVSALLGLGLELGVGVLSAMALLGAAMTLTLQHAQG